MVKRLYYVSALFVAVFAMASCAATTNAPTLPTSAASRMLPSISGGAAGKVQHVVYVVQENRSFNDVFEGYPGAFTVSKGKTSSGGTIALHEEDPELSGEGAMHEGPVSAALGIAGIPSVSESTMIARDAAIAGYEDGRIHIQHVSARESVAAIELAKAAGVKISAEASPHHLTLTDEAVRSLDANTKMNPPLRAEEDRQALIEGLRSGVLDFVATDHAPHAREEKEQPLETAPFGIIGLETAFAVLYRHWIRFHEWVTSSEIWRWARDRMARLKLLFRRAVASTRAGLAPYFARIDE